MKTASEGLKSAMASFIAPFPFLRARRQSRRERNFKMAYCALPSLHHKRKATHVRFLCRHRALRRDNQAGRNKPRDKRPGQKKQPDTCPATISHIIPEHGVGI